MSITPAFLDELRNRVPISNLVGRFVSWDQRKSSPAKGDYWAPCPFHSEKTASFHVDDRKGFYYCFGCHAKGDAIGFLKDKGNMEFIEAVRELSEMAGVPMPARDPQAQAKSDANQKLIDIHESAARFFALQLAGSVGARARGYLTNERRLSDAIISEYTIGMAANGRDILLKHLRDAGFNDNDIISAGLAINPDDGGKPFDRFRNRIMFPIRDLRGRVVAFGGRALDANARAKYLNSNETPIFHKGHILFNLDRARNHVDDNNRLIITEGYMDVIALHQAGFKTAIAPMGTALTEEQLEQIWRIDPFPIVALDGDVAGQRAARRLMEMALSKISSGRGLRFALLPAGVDPDDLIAKDGAPAMEKLINDALPMVDMLWQAVLGEKPVETPEERADFDRRLRETLKTIQDAGLRGHYLDAIKTRRSALFAPKPFAPRIGQPYVANRYKQPQGALPQTKAKSKPKGSERDTRVALVVATLLSHPTLAREFTDDLAALRADNPKLDRLRSEMIIAYGDVAAIEHLKVDATWQILNQFPTISRLSCNAPDCNPKEAREMLRRELDQWMQIDTIDTEIREIQRAMQSGVELDVLDERLHRAIKMREEIAFNDTSDDSQGQGDGDFLRQFLAAEGWRKPVNK